ncbi:uncharacterized protein LOC133362394 [Lethenteron reissneri]|uniref:uncharacterized protein LOC133362394 n=1 Tax=Lethenteron reissneri TaxID=7753 RepID=UPI002AB7372D|nr:uncharacterized protein LOC133362394 [Lethenteron reissneri]
MPEPTRKRQHQSSVSGSSKRMKTQNTVLPGNRSLYDRLLSIRQERLLSVLRLYPRGQPHPSSSGGHHHSYEDFLLEDPVYQLSVEETRRLSTHRYSACLDQTPTHCIICLEVLVEGAEICRLPCTHAHFHAACIRTWLQESGACPVCRAAVVLH